MTRTSGPLAIRWLAVALLVGEAAPPRPLAAQRAPVALAGVVRDSLGQGIAGAQVQLAGGNAKGESDSGGRFTLRDVLPGPHELVVRRIGYRPLVLPIVVPPNGEQGLLVQLQPLAQSIAPVIVRGRETLRGNAAAFYARRAAGRGRFLTADEIDQRQLWSMRDLMRTIPGSRSARVSGRQVFLLRGAATPPVVYLDGVRMAAGELDMNLLDPRTFLGIEIYSGVATTPPEYAMSDVSGRNGGVIIVWTREGRAQPRRPRRGEASAATLVAQLLETEEVLGADRVDRPAALDPRTTLSPLYPDSLLDAAIAGAATIEFVVDADGQLRTSTLSVVSATHAAFGTSATDAVLDVRFIPALLQGRAVAQVVMLTVRFEPATAPPRRSPARP